MLGPNGSTDLPRPGTPLESFSPEAGSQVPARAEHVVANLYASLRDALADNPRDAHGNYQPHGPTYTIKFSTEDYTNAEQRAETYRRTHGIRVDGVNTAWTRWVWAGERKVFEVWGAMTEREWDAAVLADPTPLPVYRVSPELVDDGGTDSYFNPGRRARLAVCLEVA